jgi:hypothetical protein
MRALWSLCLIGAAVASTGCPGPSARDLEFQRTLEARVGPMVCQSSLSSGYCCQKNTNGSYVPGYPTYCNH